MNGRKFGMIAWGFITVLLSLIALAVVVAGGLHLGPDKRFLHDTPQWLAGLYLAFIDCGTVVAGIIGFSGLAWSNFYVASTATSSKTLGGKKTRYKGGR
ncbi:hypothetical protein [Pseudomonas piscis]|uniref:hypothetical protein n=1 Tax=Pseudomonas piscis TaxID=2614538 RepID=UPI0021D5B672|nr:hypothetical protein [Pseudomonas piscis]MCU7645621.1 hypothetical protein [Pseudomonas piscis]